MRQVADASGTLDGASLDRAQAALAARTAAQPIDIAATEAELEAILQSKVHG